MAFRCPQGLTVLLDVQEYLTFMEGGRKSIPFENWDLDSDLSVAIFFSVCDLKHVTLAVSLFPPEKHLYCNSSVSLQGENGYESSHICVVFYCSQNFLLAQAVYDCSIHVVRGKVLKVWSWNGPYFISVEQMMWVGQKVD